MPASKLRASHLLRLSLISLLDKSLASPQRVLTGMHKWANLFRDVYGGSMPLSDLSALLQIGVKALVPLADAAGGPGWLFQEDACGWTFRIAALFWI